MIIDPDYSSNNFASVDPLLIIEGVRRLVQVTGLPGGSIRDVNLYKLIEIYLLDKRKRQFINLIINGMVEQHHAVVFDDMMKEFS